MHVDPTEHRYLRQLAEPDPGALDELELAASDGDSAAQAELDALLIEGMGRLWELLQDQVDPTARLCDLGLEIVGLS